MLSFLVILSQSVIVFSLAVAVPQASENETADEGGSGLPYAVQCRLNLTGWVKWVKSLSLFLPYWLRHLMKHRGFSNTPNIHTYSFVKWTRKHRLFIVDMNIVKITDINSCKDYVRSQELNYFNWLFTVELALWESRMCPSPSFLGYCNLVTLHCRAGANPEDICLALTTFKTVHLLHCLWQNL